jgi:hypothetical protein
MHALQAACYSKPPPDQNYSIDELPHALKPAIWVQKESLTGFFAETL